MSNILFVLTNKIELAVLTATLQSAYTIYTTDNTKDLAQVIKEKDIQLVVCSAAIFDKHTHGAATGPLKEDDFVKTLHDYIAGNLHNKLLSVDWLAGVMNMSRPTLYRRIRNATNQTPNELIGCARLKQAAVLLASANYKVFEVAQMTGFSSASSFSKAFLKKYKETPAAYQRKWS